MKKTVFLLLICLLLSFPAFAEDTADEILNKKLKDAGAESLSDWLDGLEPASGEEWYIFGLSDCDLSLYAEKLEKYLDGNTVRSKVTEQKYALILLKAGTTDGVKIKKIFTETTGKQGVMSYIFALHLINGGVCPEMLDEVLSGLLSLRLSDGGFAVSGSVSDPDVTAMALQSLAPLADRAEVAEVIEKGIDRLSTLQTEDGGFKSYGVENAESAATVISALSALGIDCKTDERFIKNGLSPFDFLLSFYLGDGTFSHIKDGEANEMATSEGFFALKSYENMGSSLLCFAKKDEAEEEIIPEEEVKEETAEETPAEENEIEIPEKEETETVKEATGKEPEKNIKLYIIISVASVGAVICVICLIKKKGKNAVFFAVITAVLCVAVYFIRVESVSDFHDADNSGDFTVKMSVTCEKIAGNDAEYIPSDGIILPETEIYAKNGDTVADILIKAAKIYSIQTETSGAGATLYVSGINYIYEFDFGDLSGWVYTVNGDSPSVGCGAYEVSGGDEIAWIYTLESGRDIE